MDFEIWLIFVVKVCKGVASLSLQLQAVVLPSVLSGAVIINDVDASYYSNKVPC